MEKAANGQRPPEFLNTHPSEGKRIDELNNNMPEAITFYNARKG